MRRTERDHLTKKILLHKNVISITKARTSEGIIGYQITYFQIDAKIKTTGNINNSLHGRLLKDCV